MPEDSTRTIKTKQPMRLIIGAIAVGLLVFGLVIYAVWYSAQGIADARMRGTIFAKEYVPNPDNEVDRQITIGAGGVESQVIHGRYILKVRVPKDGSSNDYDVIVSEELYNKLNVGDPFDVGPYLVSPEKN